MKSLTKLLTDLKPDPWRDDVGFSNEVEAANQRLFDRAASQEQLIVVINEWIQKHQPCLFGRIAAKCNFLSYCVLTEADLEGPDESIRDKIQAARTEWTRVGFEGQKNGFVILAISEQLARAVPDETVKQIALRLASLYLLTDVESDQVFLDEIWLEKPGRQLTTWKWSAGINYFSAQGDRRWWQDHRIPGGIAFSVNSVGHMVKSGILAKGMIALDQELDAPDEDWTLSKVDSLSKAHILAMQTISRASDGPSGKATELLFLPAGTSSCCPADLPPSLANKDCSQYLGHYHTDYTVPSEYFRSDVKRPASIQNHVLDFTYLFDRSVDNPDFIEMGDGRRIREDEITSALPEVDMVPAGRLTKMVEHDVLISDCPRLIAAIGQRREG